MLDDWDSTSGRGRYFSLCHHFQTGSGANPASYPMVTGDFPWGEGEPGNEAIPLLLLTSASSMSIALLQRNWAHCSCSGELRKQSTYSCGSFVYEIIRIYKERRICLNKHCIYNILMMILKKVLTLT
jgi:hypothetical protein